MKAEIITIGDEILIGQIVDTNSAYIAKALNNIGVAVYQISSVQDEKEHIVTALEEAERRADIIIITGGLGPTKDDVTKQSFCDFFQDELVLDKTVLTHVEDLFKSLGRDTLLEVNRLQAMVPSKGTVLHNALGTAPGMFMPKEKKVFISLPGVPYEMKYLIDNEVIPRLSKQFDTPYIYHKTILTEGRGESLIADEIEPWESALPAHIKLAYLPNYNTVRLRVSGKGEHKDQLHHEVDRQVEALLTLLGDIVIGVEEESVVQSVGKLLVEKEQTLALAESCTGGLIASSITENAGVSAFFRGSMVTYQTQTKSDILGVDEAVIADHSVVSAQVAAAMAKQTRGKFESDYAIATTGNAGPSKGDSDADVGTVYIAVASPKGIYVEGFNFGKSRIKVIHKAKNKAFELLRKEILKN